MAKKKSSVRSPLLLEVMAALGGLSVKERFLPGDATGEIVYGQQTGGLIEINPAPAIVEVVLHEVLHAIRPQWSERTVNAMTSRLFLRLNEAEMKAIYHCYKKRLT